jgi:hypothetical protein
MRTRGPLLTMAAVGVLAVVVFIVSLARTPAPDEAANIAAAAPPATTAETPPPTTPPPAPTRKSVYVGHSSDNEVTVAVAVDGEEAAAYICDGDEVEAWLDGTATEDGIELQGRNNGTRLTATLSDTAALGVLTLADKELPFSAAVAGPPAGIYEGKATVDGEPNRIGWIVLPSGRQVGINNAGGNRQPAPALDPNDLDGLAIKGVQVEIERIDGREPVVPR